MHTAPTTQRDDAVPDYQVRFDTFTLGGVAYRIRSLLDRQQYADPDGTAEQAGIAPAMWPIFGQVWPAGIFLAELMAELPLRGRRILELGCGMALASLVLHRRGADITATDHHPLAGEFLRVNLALNDLPPLPFQVADWSRTTPELGRFDLLIGSDLLYESDQPALLAEFIERHAGEQAEVILVDPGRGNHARFSRAMAARGFQQDTTWSSRQPIQSSLKKGRLLHFRRLPTAPAAIAREF